MILTKESVTWGVVCGFGGALWAGMIGGLPFAVVAFVPGFVIGLWAEASRYPGAWR